MSETAVTTPAGWDPGRYPGAGGWNRGGLEGVMSGMREPVWETWKLAHAYSRIGSGTTPTTSEASYYSSESGMPWVTTAELRETYIGDTRTYVTDEALSEFSALRVYDPGSVMIAMYGATIGRMGMTSVSASCNQACCVFERSEQFHNRFLFYWLWHRRSDLIALSAGGGQPNLSQQDLKEERALCPPVAVQKRIADFLDERTARIDGLIARKERLLALLAEKRQALITRAATKGLDPTAPMKPSGIDWLGDIPAHWEEGNIRRYAQMRTGHTPSRQEPEYWYDCSIPWFTLADVWQLRSGVQMYLGETSESISELGLANSAAELLPAGTVILSRTASVGYTGIMHNRMATSQDFWNWVCGPRLHPEFLLWQLRAMGHVFSMLTSGSTHKTIYRGDAASLRIILPPLDEQERIAAHVTQCVGKLDKIVAKITSSINHLREYRAALITAAVTGKISEIQ